METIDRDDRKANEEGDNALQDVKFKIEWLAHEGTPFRMTIRRLKVGSRVLLLLSSIIGFARSTILKTLPWVLNDSIFIFLDNLVHFLFVSS